MPFALEGIPLSVAYEGGVSDPRNSTIFKIFSLIGIGERAGSGISSINYVFETASLPIPILRKEHNPNRIFLNLSFEFTGNVTDVTDNVNLKEKTIAVDDINRDFKIVQLLNENNTISASELAKKLSVSRRTILRDLEKLKNENTIKRIGPEKGGHWEIIKNDE